MNTQHQNDLPGLIVHTPIQRLRNLMPEQVYAERWVEYMAQPPPDWRPADEDDAIEPIEVRMLRECVSDYPYPLGQREASVAATLIVWLGTPLGKCVLDAAARMRSEFQSDSVLLAWTRHNQRHGAMNNGWRSIELLLAREEDFYPEPRPVHWSPLRRAPDVTVRDIELLEHLTGWLGRDIGRGWVFACEREIARREAHAREMTRRQMQATT